MKKLLSVISLAWSLWGLPLDCGYPHICDRDDCRVTLLHAWQIARCFL